MAYPRPANLGSHGERRVVGPLMLTNIIGLIAGAATLWTLTGLFGLPASGLTLGTLLRFALTGGGAGVGIVLTLRWSGISLWDRVLLWGGFQLRRVLGTTHLTPPATRAVTAAERSVAPVLRDGRVIAEVYDPDAAQLLQEIAIGPIATEDVHA